MLGLTFAGTPAILAGALMISAAGAPIRTPPGACIAGMRTTVKIAATTDVHGHVRGWDYYTNGADGDRGLARAATIVDSLRGSDRRRVVLVDAGDIRQGTPFAYFEARASTSGPNPIIAAMNAMRYDAADIGNHEFNYGVPYLEPAAAQEHFPFLAANLAGTRIHIGDIVPVVRLAVSDARATESLMSSSSVCRRAHSLTHNPIS